MSLVAPASVLALATTLILVFGPGAFVLRVWVGSWWSALLLAPSASALVVAILGGLLRLGGLRPDRVALVAGILLLTSTGWIASVLIRRRSKSPEVPIGPHWHSARVAVILVLAAGAAFTGIAVTAMGGLNSWPQMPDNIFHVGAVTWMLRHDTTWLGDVQGNTGMQPGVFPYPGLWHSIVASATVLSGADATTTSNALAIVVGGLVWPASMCLFARVALGDSKTVAGLTPLVATSLTAMPFVPMAIGVTWPLLLGCAILPVALAGACAWLAGSREPEGSIRWIVVLALLGTVACTLAHPSMVYSLLLLVAPLVFIARRRGKGPRWLSVVVLVVGVLALSIRQPLMVELGAAHPPWTFAQAAQAFLVIANSPVAIVWWILIGLSLTHPAVRALGPWLFTAMLLPLLLGSMAFMLPGWLTRSLTWPWWNDELRLRSLGAIAMCVLIVAGASALAKHELARHRSVALLGVLAVGIIFCTAAAGNLSLLRETYSPTILRPWWVTSQDRVALAELANRLPIGARVLADPYAGGTHLYLTRDISLVLPTERTNEADPQLGLLARRVNRVLDDPAVCRAARAQGLEYVVSGGEQSIWMRDRGPEFAGIGAVDESGGFTRLATEGRYTLWRVPSCP